MNPNIETAFALAKQQYAALGVDVDQALTTLATIPVSMHCWQGDDVGGFEADAGALTGGIQATGNYPGKARDAIELRRDLDLAMSLIPGAKRLNMHAIYLEAESPVARDKIEPKHFANWVRWAKERGVGLDFNPSCFSHPLSADGMTLSHPDPEIRRFWIDHCKASRRISASFGQALGTPSVMNIWIPDGMKDLPADRLGPRQRLMAALDEVLAERIDEAHHIDAVESKLFGIGAESYTVGSNEFYLGYAGSRDIALCLDAGHFHPTEVISDKISAASLFVRHLLLHVSRPVRWDSDHVVLLDDETQAIANEIIRNELLERVHIGLDFFDASINRIAAWVIGTRNMKKALLRALLEPIEMLRQAECKGDYSTRLALMEETRSLPWQAVWDYACAREGSR
ncbi:L-rhamnose isomerase [Aeromonas hydrophila]